MFFGKKEEPVVIETPKAEEPKPVEPPKPKKNEPIKKTTIGEGITFYGNFETKDPMEINGTVKGDISSSSSVSITETGAINGNADVYSLRTDGTIDGNVKVEDMATFTGTSKLKGNLTTTYLETEKGSKILGKLELKQEEYVPVKEEPAPAAKEQTDAEEPAEKRE